jgi:hypothetical protein
MTPYVELVTSLAELRKACKKAQQEVAKAIRMVELSHVRPRGRERRKDDDAKGLPENGRI